MKASFITHGFEALAYIEQASRRLSPQETLDNP
jgi:hypothetical protein